MIELINSLPDSVRDIDAIYAMIRTIALIFNLRFYEDASLSID